jgi:hypothetical protein
MVGGSVGSVGGRAGRWAGVSGCGRSGGMWVRVGGWVGGRMGRLAGGSVGVGVGSACWSVGG